FRLQRSQSPSSRLGAAQSKHPRSAAVVGSFGSYLPRRRRMLLDRSLWIVVAQALGRIISHTSMAASTRSNRASRTRINGALKVLDYRVCSIIAEGKYLH